MAHRSLSNSMNNVAEGLKEAKIKSEESEEETVETIGMRLSPPKKSIDNEPPATSDMKSSASPDPGEFSLNRPHAGGKVEKLEEIGGDITLKMEPGEPPKLARTAAQKVPARTVPLFDDLPDSTGEATRTFQVIASCTYSPKHLGDTEHAMECDCAEEWDDVTKTNVACGEDSDCINRATKMECYGDCGCGNDCENQRFQRQQWAKVSVINTEKKGRGLRADVSLRAGDFIFEYIGEVVNEVQFRKRMVQYDEEGIKHFYFMSLNRGEFVDATKRGNLGRFCNHSCNPNCYVDKWVVGNKLRMGIFAERKIKAGEELVFNYNVDRYGADPQPCYCGEPNCTGFIGGKTQTERATKLPQVTIEALGIDDGDGWDIAVAKKPRKKRANEDDEEYVNIVQPRSLDEDGVTKVMASLLQNKEKWITVKLLSRIEQCEEEKIISRVVKMHGYQILKSVLSAWKEDVNVVIQVFNVLDKFPRLTKNKITDSKIEETVQEFKQCGDDRIESRADILLQAWSTLETAYRIPRKKRDPNAPAEQQTQARIDSRRRSRSRSRSTSPTKTPPRGPAIPSGPRGGGAGRGGFFGNRPPFRPPRSFGPLPDGWFQASSNGRTYYYNSSGHTQWQRPNAPASKPIPPPPPPKATPANKALDDIINEITSAKSKASEKPPTNPAPPSSAEEAKPKKRESKEKWKQYSEEKQKKIYENTLFPHVKAVVDRYKHELPKEDCKRFFKEICKKLVSSDYKNNRVQDPTQISEKQIKNVKKYTKDFFDKAVAKKKAHDLKKEQRKAIGSESTAPNQEQNSAKKDEESDIEPMEVSDEEPSKDGQTKTETPATPLEQFSTSENHKRKRTENGTDEMEASDGISTPSKRTTFASPTAPPAPPPPPPPPDDAEDSLMNDSGEEPVDGLLVKEESVKDPEVTTLPSQELAEEMAMAPAAMMDVPGSNRGKVASMSDTQDGSETAMGDADKMHDQSERDDHGKSSELL